MTTTGQLDARIVRRLERVLAEASARLDSSFVWAPIPPEMSFRQWCDSLAQERTDRRTARR